MLYCGKESSPKMSLKINRFIDKLFIEYEKIEEARLDRAESNEIREHLRVLNIDGFNHDSYMQYINGPLSDLRTDLRKIKE